MQVLKAVGGVDLFLPSGAADQFQFRHKKKREREPRLLQRRRGGKWKGRWGRGNTENRVYRNLYRECSMEPWEDRREDEEEKKKQNSKMRAKTEEKVEEAVKMGSMSEWKPLMSGNIFRIFTDYHRSIWLDKKREGAAVDYKYYRSWKWQTWRTRTTAICDFHFSSPLKSYILIFLFLFPLHVIAPRHCVTKLLISAIRQYCEIRTQSFEKIHFVIIRWVEV